MAHASDHSVVREKCLLSGMSPVKFDENTVWFGINQFQAFLKDNRQKTDSRCSFDMNRIKGFGSKSGYLNHDESLITLEGVISYCFSHVYNLSTNVH